MFCIIGKPKWAGKVESDAKAQSLRAITGFPKAGLAKA